MKKFENYCAALKNLEEIFDYDEPYGNVILTGLVGLYEIFFEQSWKAIKEILEFNGVPEGQTGSPRQILKSAYQAGIIENEELWLDALRTRNNIAHSYNQAISLDIVRKAKEKFYQIFVEWKKEIEQNWSE